MNTQIRNTVCGLVAVTVVSLAGSAFAGPATSVQPRLKPIVPPPVANPATPRLGIMGHLQHHWGFGMVVDAVNPGSTADRIGLERGDKIIQINNRQINSDRSYDEALWNAARFQHGRVTLTVIDVRTGRTTQRSGHLYTAYEHSQPRFAPRFNTSYGNY